MSHENKENAKFKRGNRIPPWKLILMKNELKDDEEFSDGHSPTFSNNPVRKDGKKRELLHNILKEYSFYVKDIFWKEFLIECAYGSFPNYFSIWNGKLAYKKEKKVDSLTLFKDPEVGSGEFINFMKNYGIKSPENIKNESSIENVEYSWKYYNRKKKLKSYFVKLYANDIGAKKGYTLEEIDRLYSYINMYFDLGYIKSGDVVFKKSRITKIKGLEFNDIDRSVYPSKDRNFNISKPPKTKKEKDTFKNYWDKKFSYRKKRGNNNIYISKLSDAGSTVLERKADSKKISKFKTERKFSTNQKISMNLCLSKDVISRRSLIDNQEKKEYSQINKKYTKDSKSDIISDSELDFSDVSESDSESDIISDLEYDLESENG